MDMTEWGQALMVGYKQQNNIWEKSLSPECIYYSIY